MCRSCSGARSAARRTPSRSRASSTRSRTRPARTPTNFAARCSPDRPDFLAVLDKLAEKGEWGKPMPKGTGARASRSTKASALSSARSPKSRSADSGDVKVERVVACVDCGHVVNPLTVEMQIESAVLYGLTAALFGEITIKKGRRRAEQFRRLRDRADGGRARRSRPISRSRAAANGAASASPARRRSRPPSPTRSSPPRASASVRCR